MVVLGGGLFLMGEVALHLLTTSTESLFYPSLHEHPPCAVAPHDLYVARCQTLTPLTAPMSAWLRAAWRLQGYLAHNTPPPPQDQHRALVIGLL